ncbi:MAG: 4a-hydroxytetrahydrobiopterin dehydratase [Pseudomonadota bacterium]
MPTPLTDDQRAALTSELPHWAKTDDGRDAIHRTYEFKNFIEAFSFMSAAALWAEKLDHHPEWSNVYKTVNVTLTTHDAGGLTDLDIRLAQAMDALAS